MTHLKKSATGHLLKTTDGHLVKTCEAVPPVNTCHECDPPIPDTLVVTISGLTGVAAVWNGTWPLTWREECFWRYIRYPPDPPYNGEFVQLMWASVPITQKWYIKTLVGTCMIGFVGSQLDCDPTGDYSLYNDWCGGAGGSATVSLSYT